MGETIVLEVLSDPEDADEQASALNHDIREIISSDIALLRPKGDSSEGAKGEPITTGIIILTMVGAGGFLTVAAAPGGFLTKLADILNDYVNRGVKLKVTRPDGTSFEAEGSASDIESAIKNLPKA